jgi:hypothetical protein
MAGKVREFSKVLLGKQKVKGFTGEREGESKLL